MVIRDRLIKLIILALLAFAIMPAVTSFAGTINYTYDELNRLKTEEYGEDTNKTVIEYQYDKLGNRTNRVVTLPFYTVTASADCGGSISPLSVQVTKGHAQAFTITPPVGYDIASVAGSCGGTLSETTYTTAAITAACNVTASFSVTNYPLNVTLHTDGDGSGAAEAAVTVDTCNDCFCTSKAAAPDLSTNVSCTTSNCTTSGVSYPYRADVKLTAAPYKTVGTKYYEFRGWTGCDTISGANNEICAVTMINPKSITANYMQVVKITVMANGSGYISPDGGVTQIRNATVEHKVDYGSPSRTYSIQADSSAGYHIGFVNDETGRVITNTGNLPVGTSLTVNTTANHTVEAKFIINKYILSITQQKSGVGIEVGGTVSFAPKGIECSTVDCLTYSAVSCNNDPDCTTLNPPASPFECSSATCTQKYAHGSHLELTAAGTKGPNEWYDFTGWSGAGCSGTGSCSIAAMASDLAITASYIQTFIVSAIANSDGLFNEGGCDSASDSCRNSSNVLVPINTKYYKVPYSGNLSLTATPNPPYPAAMISWIQIDNGDIINNISNRASYNKVFSQVADNHTIKAFFSCVNPPPPVKVVDDYFQTLQEAYNSPLSTDQLIQVYATGFEGDLTISKNINLDGGYNCNFSGRAETPSTITGMMDVTDGTSSIGSFSIGTSSTGGSSCEGNINPNRAALKTECQ